jgi:SAM-dependent methyltransferase
LVSWDDWHSAIASSAASDRRVRKALGLPSGMKTNSMLPWAGIADVAEMLRLAPGDLLGGDAGFFVGDYTAAGLRDGCADAVVCVDAMQFADPPLAGLRECRRLLSAGGRIAVTAWEALDPADERQPERTRRMNLARDLAAAGFGRVEVTERPDWLAAERALWEAAAVAPRSAGDPGLTSLRDEGIRSLEVFGGKRRVLAAAIA